MLDVCPNRRVILLRNTPHRSFPPDGPDYLLQLWSHALRPIDTDGCDLAIESQRVRRLHRKLHRFGNEHGFRWVLLQHL